MHKVKKLLLVALVLLVLVAGVVFMLENQQPVNIVVLGYTGPQLPVAVLIIAAFLAGMVVGPVLAALSSLRRRRKVVSRPI